MRRSGWLAAVGLLLASTVLGRVSEPDNVFFGNVTRDGGAVNSGTVEVRINGSEQALASSAIDANQPGRYGLRVPIDSVEPQMPGTARNGDQALFYLNGELAGRAIIGERGALSELNLDRAFNDVDLQLVSLTDANDPTIAGQALTYTATVRNNGPGAEPAPVLTLNLAAGVNYVVASPSTGGTCDSAGLIVTCHLAQLDPNQTNVVTVNTTVSASVANGSNLGVSASVAKSDSTDDRNPANNAASGTTAVQRRTDLEVFALTGNPHPNVVAGQTLQYSISLRNNGSSDASGVVLTDTLPAGVTLTLATPSQGSCVGTSSISCNLGALSAGQTATVVLDTQVAATVNVGSILRNTAGISASEVDPTPANNSRFVDTIVSGQADLSVVFLSAPTSTAAGQTVQYKLQVSNGGPSQAGSVSLRNVLPFGVRFVSGAGCSSIGRVVTCDLATLAPSAQRTVDIDAVVETWVQNGVVLTDTASVTSSSSDPASANNSASTQATVTVNVAVSVVQAATPDPALAGQPLDWVVTLSNAGPSNASNVVLTQVLPTETTLTSWSTQPQRTLYSLDASTALLHVLDPNTYQTTASRPIIVPGATVTAGVALGLDGQTGDLWALVRLQGQPTPELVRLDPATGTASRLADTADEFSGLAVTSDRNLYAVTNENALLPEELYRIDRSTGATTFVLDLDSGLGAGDVLTFDPDAGHLVHASSGQLERITFPNSRTPLNVQGGLPGTPRALAYESPNAWLYGNASGALYRLTGGGSGTEVTAHSLGTLSHVSAGLAITPPIACSVNAGTLTCKLGGLAVGQQHLVDLKLSVLATAFGPLQGRSTVTFNETDGQPSDNTNVVKNVAVDRKADLAVGLLASSDPVNAGQPLTYTAQVKNRGPGAATDVELTVNLPVGATFSSLNDPNNCQAVGGVVDCSYPVVAKDETKTVDITVNVPLSAAQGSQLTASATATSNETDPVATNNTKTLQTLVNRITLLALVVTDANDPVAAGEQLRWTVQASNGGPSQASAVSLTLTLPAGVSFVRANDPACTEASGLVNCNLNTLNPNASRTLQIDGLVSSTAEAGSTLTAQTELRAAEQASVSTNTGTSVIRRTSLSLTVQDSNDPVAAGQPLSYLVQAANAGPSQASGVTFSLPLPAGTSFSSVNDLACQHSSGTVTCNFGTLGVAASRNIVITTNVASTAADSSTLTATGTLASNEQSSVQASASTTVRRQTSLLLTLLDANDPVIAGHDLRYTLQATNNGPSQASGVSLSLTLPAQVGFSSVSDPNCTPSAGTVTCDFSTMATGASRTVQVVVSVPATTAAGTTLNASATLASNEQNSVLASASTAVQRQTALVVSLTDANDPVVAGNGLTYTLQATNNGPSQASGVSLSLALPSGVSFGSADDGSCNPIGNTLVCGFGTLASGSTRTVHATVTVASTTAANTVLSATATLAANEQASVQSTTTTTVLRQTALVASVVDANDPVTAGHSLSYTLQTTNNGPSQASGVVLSFALPSQVSFSSVNDPNCTPAAGTVTCSFGNLNAGASRSVLVVTAVPATVAAGATLTATATVSGNEQSSVQSTATTTVQRQTNLLLTLADANDPVTAGHNLNYTLQATNEGPSQASGVSLSFVLPAQVTFNSANDANCSHSAGTVTCSFGTLNANANRTVQVSVGVPSTTAAGAVLSASATLAANEQASVPASATTTVQRQTALTVSLTDANDPVIAGHNLTYTLQASNAGPSQASGLILSLSLPAQTSFGSANDPNCIHSSGTVTCSVGTLGAGSNKTVIVTAAVPSGTAAGISLNATTTLASSEQASVQASASTTVQRQTSLVVSAVDANDPVTAGNSLAYTLQATNNGPSDASGVSLTFALPVQWTFGSVDDPNCMPSAGSLNCNFGSLASGASRTVQVTGTVASTTVAGTVLSATATLAASEQASVQSTATTTVQRQTSLVVSLVDANDPVIAGQNLTYTLQATNNGPSQASGVRLVLPLPSNVSFSSVSDPNCVFGTGSVNCDLGNLNANGSRNIQVIGTVASTTVAGTVLSATATLSGNEQASVQSTATTTVQRQTHLLLTLADANDPVTAGNNLNYTLQATNEGPSQASGVSLSLSLPPEVTFASTTDPNCVHSAGSVTCDFGTLNASATRTVQVSVAVPSTTASGVVLSTSASLSATEQSSVQASATTTVQRQTALLLTVVDANDPVTAGHNLSYTVQATNNGQSQASNVNLSLTLPAQAGFVSVDDGTCSHASGILSCSFGTLNAGASRTVHLTTAVAASAAHGAVLSAVGTLSSTEQPSIQTTATTTVQRVVDVRIASLTVNPDPPVAGANLDLVATFQNSGASDASGVQVVLEASAPFVAASGSNGCAVNGRQLQCTFASLAAGASQSVTLTGAYVATLAEGTALTFQATGTPTESDPNNANNTQQLQRSLAVHADLVVTNSASLPTATAGQPLTYTLQVQNQGPSEAQFVELIDELPTEVAFQSVSWAPTPALYTVSKTSSRLRRVDPATGITSFSVAMTVPGKIVLGGHALATSPLTGKLWALLRLSGVDGYELVEVDVVTGVCRSVGNTGLQLETMSFSDEDGKLYAVSADDAPSAEVLYTVNVLDAHATAVVSVGSGSPGEALGAVTGAGELMHLSGGSSAGVSRAFETIDPITLEVFSIDSSGATYGTPLAVAPQPFTADQLLLLDDQRKLYQVDLDGLVTAGATVDHTASSLAFAPPSHCSEQDGTIGCLFGGLKVGQSASVTILTLVNQDALGPLVNRASAFSDTFDPDVNDSVNVDLSVPIQRTADLVSQAPSTPNPVVAGTDLTYTVLTRNAGPSSATAVQWSLTLPTDTVFQSASDPNACLESAGVVTCHLGNLSLNASRSLSIVAEVDSTVADGASLAAQLTTSSSNENDPNHLNDELTLATAVQRRADLNVNLTAPANVLTGTNLTWDLALVNEGASQASNVVLTQTLPAGLTFVSTTDATNCSNTAQLVRCTVGDMSTQGQYTVAVTAAVASSIPATTAISLVAQVTGTEVDPETADNQITRTVEARRQVSLQPFFDTVTPDPATAGQTVAYGLHVSNGGPSDASQIVLNVTLPTDLEFVSGADCSTTSGSPVCTIASIAANSQGTASFTARVKSSAAVGAVLAATVGVSAQENDPNTTDDQATANVTVQRSADLSVRHSAWTLQPVAGRNLDFTLQVSNVGPSDASGVVLTNDLPVGVSFVSATNAGCSALTARQVKCDMGFFSVAQQKEVTLTGRLAADSAVGTMLTNSVSAALTEPDPNTTDNTSSQAVAVTVEADLMVSHQLPTAKPVAGENFTYTVKVTNLGASAARDVALNHPLPDQSSFVSTSQGCILDGTDVQRTAATLEVDASVQCQVTVLVLPDARQQLTIEATAASAAFDPNMPNSTAVEASADILTEADLVAAWGAMDPNWIAGAETTATLQVQNIGPSQAGDVRAILTLPLNVQFVSSSRGDQPCVATGQVVTCDLGDLDADGTLDLPVQLLLDAATPHGSKVQLAMAVLSAEPDPQSSNSSASTPQLNVMTSSDLAVAVESQVLPNSKLSYAIEVANSGPSDAKQVQLKFELKAPLQLDTAPQGCTEVARMVTCALGNLTADQEKQLTIVAAVRTSSHNPLTVVAEVSSAETDAVMANNTDTLSVAPPAIIGVPLSAWAIALLGLLCATLLRRRLSPVRVHPRTREDKN